MPTVQQRNIKDTVTMPTCPRNSHKGISARKRSEKNRLAAIELIPMGILLISHVQDNIPIPPVA
ncbi:hypothetical protein [Rhizobium johnstonii]|uniref:hypothetical protein n=1 Tax=Rhizobium johnstonii TaxID=3019933 RepID=UPI003F99E518